MSTPLQRLSELGQSVWIDSISRQWLQSGELAALIAKDSVVGLTSNPTIFEQAIAGGDLYDEQIRERLDAGAGAKDVFWALAERDIRAACDLLAPTWEQTGGRDGYVSIEVEPEIAHDAEATVTQARHLHELIDRPNLFVKIPATEAGLSAIEDSIAAGISINVTLIFALRRHAEVIEAYLRGLERLAAAGGDPSLIKSVASFFVSRVDTEADRRLEEIGAAAELRGRLAIANAKLAYQTYLEAFANERWDRLAALGATPQRCLWASTSTKNPAYRDVVYVEELIGPDTVNTMPLATVRAFQDHGEATLTLTEGIEEARELLDRLAQVGIDYDDVTATLEREGVEKFGQSFEELLQGIERKSAALAR